MTLEMVDKPNWETGARDVPVEYSESSVARLLCVKTDAYDVWFP